MSGGLEALSLKSDDMLKLLGVSAHTGAENLDYQMEQYVFKRSSSGTHLINLRKTWEKLLLAARAIVSIKNPADVYVISSYVKSQRAILKFASHTGATPIAGRFTPGTFTNQIQKNFKEPLLLIVSDPYVDHQPIMEAACVNIPVIGFCNSETPMKYVDIAIPCNNKGSFCIGLMFWMLAREILRFRGTIPRNQSWEVMPDLYFYREPEEAEKEAILDTEKPQDEQIANAGLMASKISDQTSLLAPQWSTTASFMGEKDFGGPQIPPDMNIPNIPPHMMSPIKQQHGQPIQDTDDWHRPPSPIHLHQQSQPPQHYMGGPGAGNVPAQYLHGGAMQMPQQMMGIRGGPPQQYMHQQQSMEGPPSHYRANVGSGVPPRQDDSMQQVIMQQPAPPQHQQQPPLHQQPPPHNIGNSVKSTNWSPSVSDWASEGGWN
ncbi:unnamed protein product [Gordionus sp. m RMFG-2023]|uniref:small ribosomal subunit protein uS2-like n=1 Tax=Gordionus sp. m RMFG-2023 TaxID=3053472 RepID=UPI0030E21354